MYIPTSDAFDPLLLGDDLWGTDPERAIALMATRELMFNRGAGLLGSDVDKIAGINCWV